MKHIGITALALPMMIFIAASAAGVIVSAVRLIESR